MITDSILEGFKEAEIKNFVSKQRPELEKEVGNYTILVAKNNPKSFVPDPHYMLLWISTGFGSPGSYFHFEIQKGADFAVVKKVSDPLEIMALSDVRKLSRNFPR